MYKLNWPCSGALLLRLGFIIIAQFWPARAGAQEFCAVTLSVSGSDGAPITSTWIELVDPAGKVVRREMINGPTARICDFGFGPHTLRVGVNECLPVAVSNLRVVLGAPVHLDVMLSACGYRETARNTCLVYFRTRDGDGSPVPSVNFAPRITDAPPLTDSYGRYQSLFLGSRDITFTKAGFQPAVVHLKCQANEEIDQTVVMLREALGR